MVMVMFAIKMMKKKLRTIFFAGGLGGETKWLVPKTFSLAKSNHP